VNHQVTLTDPDLPGCRAVPTSGNKKPRTPITETSGFCDRNRPCGQVLESMMMMMMITMMMTTTTLTAAAATVTMVTR
jgi:hypothetical protein